jgi:hypothetical protein
LAISSSTARTVWRVGLAVLAFLVFGLVVDRWAPSWVAWLAGLVAADLSAWSCSGSVLEPLRGSSPSSRFAPMSSRTPPSCLTAGRWSSTASSQPTGDPSAPNRSTPARGSFDRAPRISTRPTSACPWRAGASRPCGSATSGGGKIRCLASGPRHGAHTHRGPAGTVRWMSMLIRTGGTWHRARAVSYEKETEFQELVRETFDLILATQTDAPASSRAKSTRRSVG